MTTFKESDAERMIREANDIVEESEIRHARGGYSGEDASGIELQELEQRLPTMGEATEEMAATRGGIKRGESVPRI